MAAQHLRFVSPSVPPILLCSTLQLVPLQMLLRSKQSWCAVEMWKWQRSQTAIISKRSFEPINVSAGIWKVNHVSTISSKIVNISCLLCLTHYSTVLCCQIINAFAMSLYCLYHHSSSIIRNKKHANQSTRNRFVAQISTAASPEFPTHFVRWCRKNGCPRFRWFRMLRKTTPSRSASRSAVKPTIWFMKSSIGSIMPRFVQKDPFACACSSRAKVCVAVNLAWLVWNCFLCFLCYTGLTCWIFFWKLNIYFMV